MFGFLVLLFLVNLLASAAASEFFPIDFFVRLSFLLIDGVRELAIPMVVDRLQLVSCFWERGKKHGFELRRWSIFCG